MLLIAKTDKLLASNRYKDPTGGYFIARADKLIAGLEGRFNAGKKKNDPRHKSCELGR